MQDPKDSKWKKLIHSILDPRWYWVAVISLILSLLSIGMLFWTYQISERQRADFEFCDTLMDIQIHSLSSHLWLEEVMSGRNKDIQKITDDLNLAISLAEASLKGGKSEHGQPLEPIQDSRLRKAIAEIESLLRESKEITLQRLQDPGAGGADSVLDQRLDAILIVIQRKANELEIGLEKNLIKAQAQRKSLFLGILLTWIFIVFLATLGIWNREVRRKAAEEALQKANGQLRDRAEELRKHEVHLAELVEERTAALRASNRSLQQEINERKEAEKFLLASANKFRTLLETLPQRIFLKNKNSVYLHCNENYAQDLDIRPYEIFGKTDVDFYPRELAERHLEEDRRILKSDKAEEIEERYLRRGQEVVVRKILLPIKNEAGETSNLLGILWDITEKIRLESIAEAANMMTNIGYIFAGIRHEIGNPINSIKITLSVLKKKMDAFSPATIHDYIDRALAELSRMEYLLKTLKNFNMYETPEIQNISMNSFMERFLALVADDFEKEGIMIRSRIEPEAVWGYADPRALQQVLLNILSNASNALAGKEKGEIAIRVLKAEGLIKIRLTDNGCGISQEQQKELFKPFRTTKAGGTGLGLVIAKKMLTGMNGTIEIWSREGEGTTVNISIPEGSDEHS